MLSGALAFALSDTVRFVVCSIAAIVFYGNPSQMDRQNAQFIADGITAAHHFTQNSVSQPSRPPLFWTPASSGLLSQPAAFQIYDIRERSEQEKVIDAVKAAIASSKVKAVDIRFLDHETG
jgi:hypothetical protein